MSGPFKLKNKKDFDFGKKTFTISGGPKAKDYKSEKTKEAEKEQFLKKSKPGMEWKYDWKYRE
jgi:hypothetical protein